MKRHLNSLLQRSHADFSDLRSPGPRHPAPKPPMVGVQDGYDWLALIKRESSQRQH